MRMGKSSGYGILEILSSQVIIFHSLEPLFETMKNSSHCLKRIGIKSYLQDFKRGRTSNLSCRHIGVGVHNLSALLPRAYCRGCATYNAIFRVQTRLIKILDQDGAC